MRAVFPARRAPGATLALIVTACTVACGHMPASTPAAADAAGTLGRGGTLRLVGSSDVDRLTTTSAGLISSQWLMRAFARQLVAYPAALDYESATALAADIAHEIPTPENGGISVDGRLYTFHLQPEVRWNSTPPRRVTAHDFVRAFKLFCNPVMPVEVPGYYTATIAGLANYCSAFVKARHGRRHPDVHRVA